MRRALAFPAVLVVAVLGAGVAVRAEQAPVADRPTSGWILTPSIGVGGSWDDNVLLATAGSDPQGDYGTPITPSGSLEYRGRRTRLSSAYAGSFLRYRTLTGLNTSEHGIRTTVNHRATSRLTLSADQSFTQAPTTDALKLAGLPFYRVGSRTHAVGGGFEAAIARGTVLRSGYALRSVRFDADPETESVLQGGHVHEALVRVGRALSRRLTTGLQYQVHRAVLARGADTFQTHTAGVTAQYDVTPLVTVSGLLGVARLGGGLTHEGRTAPTIAADVTSRARRAILSASYERSFIPSFGFGGTFQNEGLRGSVRVPFARGRAFTDSNATWSNSQPLERSLPGLRATAFSQSIGYYATRWLRGEGFFVRSQLDTRFAGGNVRRNQAGFRLVAEKPVKLR